MQPYNASSSQPGETSALNILLLLLAVPSLLYACGTPAKIPHGITYLASRGSRPSAERVVWSPTDENKMLVTAYESPNEPAEVYILDTRTGQQDMLEKQLPAYFYEARWMMPDGKRVLILAENNTIGFEPSGWWTLDTENKASKYFMAPDDIALSPDGKALAILHADKLSANTGWVLLQLMNLSTNVTDTIATYKGNISSAGLSWSPDGQYVVYSVGGAGIEDLYILDVRTRLVKQITSDGGNESPVWSPKGNVIAYVGGISLYLISPDAKCKVAFQGLEHVWSPTWSPDGKKLGYIGIDGIYALDANVFLGRDIYRDLCS